MSARIPEEVLYGMEQDRDEHCSEISSKVGCCPRLRQTRATGNRSSSRHDELFPETKVVCNKRLQAEGLEESWCFPAFLR